MRTLIIKTNKNNQSEQFEQLAKELGLTIQVIDDNDQNAIEKQIAMALADSAFAKDWNSKEDEHWDEFLKKK